MFEKEFEEALTPMAEATEEANEDFEPVELEEDDDEEEDWGNEDDDDDDEWCDEEE